MRTIINELPNRNNFLHGRYTVEIGYPWFSYGAIMAVEEQVKLEHNVLELGSGGSTIFFSKRCKSVKSYETSPTWEKKVKSVLPDPSNVFLICGDTETLIESVKNEPYGYYDWLIVDSASIGRRFKFRFRMMIESIPKLKTGGFMVVDNYGSDHLNTFDYSGWKVYTFDDFRYGGMGTRICIKN